MQSDCMNVHYIELFTDSLFTEPTLQSKVTLLPCCTPWFTLYTHTLTHPQVLSAGIQDFTMAMTIIVRIHSNQNLGVIPSQEE